MNYKSRNNVFPLRNYCLYLVPTFVLLALPIISHIFRKCMLCCVSILLFIFLSLPSHCRCRFFASNRYTHLCRSLLILFGSTAKASTSEREKKELKLSEALQSFSGWCIAFYIGVDQGRR